MTLVFSWIVSLGLSLAACSKKTTAPVTPPVQDSSLVNTAHLDHLYTPVKFSNGDSAAAVYIYSNYPDYTNVEATGEGFACVDDVSRACLVYLRTGKYLTDISMQQKLIKLIRFMMEMQSTNNYFYNFLQSNGQINAVGGTSINTPNWWSWRALQALTECAPAIKGIDLNLYNKMNVSINNLITQIKTDLVSQPLTSTTVSGITIPTWLPAGSGTDQASLMVIGLINYCTVNNDPVMQDYIKKLVDGILLMQTADSTKFPFGAFLSWQNTWHAYGNTQAYALLKAGKFLNNPVYTQAALTEINNFYPWLLQNGMESDFSILNNAGTIQTLTIHPFAQIAYGIEPMVFAAAEAYDQTGQQPYADLAGHLAAWFLGANTANTNMYSVSNGVCFDGISSATSVNLNSGAESTIEALLTIQKVSAYPAVLTAFKKYKK